MKVIPKAKRHKIYIEAKASYMETVEERKENEDYLLCGICFHLRYTTLGCKFFKDGYMNMKDVLPEFAKMKPNTEYAKMRNYWWPEENTKARIAAFDEMIERSKPKRRK